MYKRNLTAYLQDGLGDTPVVLLNGARQTGKSTLAENIPGWEGQYYTFDETTTLSLAKSDPEGFIFGLPEHVILDEIQHVPELFRAIKLMVDRKRTPGKFLLTGSANVLLLPKLSESLAGRMEILTLWPLSQGEIHGIKENLIDLFFENPILYTTKKQLNRLQLIERIVQGGYPEVVRRENHDRRKAWFDSYLTAILQGDVRDISNIESLTELPRLLTLLAGRAANLLNFADLSRDISIPQTTLKRYISLLEMTFLIKYLPAWSINHNKRLVKSPKILLNDTGLLCHLLGVDTKRLQHDPHILGKILENFIAMEICKQASWSQSKPKLFHFRTQTGYEVDLVLENAAGEIIGIEIKTSNQVTASDLKGLHHLAEIAGKKFVGGIILYTGTTSVPAGKKMFAFPIHLLWEDL